MEIAGTPWSADKVWGHRRVGIDGAAGELRMWSSVCYVDSETPLPAPWHCGARPYAHAADVYDAFEWPPRATRWSLRYHRGSVRAGSGVRRRQRQAGGLAG